MTPANAKQWAELSAAQSERRRIEALEEDVIILRDSFYDMSSWDVDASPESTRRRWRQGINKCLDELTNQALNDVGEILRHEGLLADNAARPSSFEAVMKNPARVRVFAPEAWTQTDFFKIFQGGTHKLKADGVKALSGVSNHFRKASLLYGLAIKILPNLQIDEQELMDKGHTSAINGAELTAVLEEVFTELYASVECIRKVITGIYAGTPKLPTDSTRRFFIRVMNDEIGSPFPQELISAVKGCRWFEQLRAIRDELTHADIGHCSTDRENKTVTYMHQGVKDGDSSLVIIDAMRHIDDLASDIDLFARDVFRYLNSQLQPTVVTQICGIFDGRVYVRNLPLDHSLTFHTGECISYAWFEDAEGRRCPFADNCGAYYAAKGIDR